MKGGDEMAVKCADRDFCSFSEETEICDFCQTKLKGVRPLLKENSGVENRFEWKGLEVRQGDRDN